MEGHFMNTEVFLLHCCTIHKIAQDNKYGFHAHICMNV